MKNIKTVLNEDVSLCGIVESAIHDLIANTTIHSQIVSKGARESGKTVNEFRECMLARVEYLLGVSTK